LFAEYNTSHGVISTFSEKALTESKYRIACIPGGGGGGEGRKKTQSVEKDSRNHGSNVGDLFEKQSRDRDVRHPSSMPHDQLCVAQLMLAEPGFNAVLGSI